MSERKSKIGIVGGSGFVGGSLAKHFSRNFSAKVLDVKPPSYTLESNVSYEYCDIRSYDNIRSALSDVELVIHTAIIQIPQINEKKNLAYEVNILGTQNVCEAVNQLPNIKGMILSGSWHTIGERELTGVINEEFGFRPDKVENRARLYALSKMAQEAIVRFYDELSDKIYGIIRMGTVLGEGMPEKTAANIFIKRGLKGESLTPYKHSMYRPMLYVDVDDVCKAYESYVKKILNNETKKTSNSLDHIVNVYCPEPVTILELAETIRDIIIKYADGRVNPSIEIVDKDVPPIFSKEDKSRIKVDISKVKKLLGISSLLSPKESTEKIVKNRLNAFGY